MKKTLIIFFLLFSLLGCSVASRPNVSAIYRVPDLKAKLPPLPGKTPSSIQEPLPVPVQVQFQRLYERDPNVALEVGRLPEFQGEIGDRQIVALNRFTELFLNATSEEKKNLTEILEEGLPGVRRYCAPLQAVFWLLEKETYKPGIGTNPLGLSLEELMQQAWRFFTEEYRWSDFKVVTDRLNSPRLINLYEQMNFSYVSHGRCPGNARQIFRFKTGCCSDYTAFSVYCLQKAGYEAGAIKVVSPTGKSYHVVCEYKDGGKKYVMDNSAGRGIMKKEIYVQSLPQIGFGYE